MKQPSATERTVEEQAVEEHVAPATSVAPATTEEASLDGLREMASQDISFLAFFTRAGLEVSIKDLKRLCMLSRGDVQKKGYYFNLLAYDGLFPQCGELTDEECSRFLFMTQEEKPEWEAKLAGIKARREAQRARDQLTEADTRNVADAPARQHRARGKPRTSYISPSREDTVTIAAHAGPELKEALKKKFEQSGFEHFNDFLVASLQRIAQEPPVEIQPAAELAETALTQSRELQKTISRLTQDLSTRPSRSR